MKHDPWPIEFDDTPDDGLGCVKGMVFFLLVFAIVSFVLYQLFFKGN